LKIKVIPLSRISPEVKFFIIQGMQIGTDPTHLNQMFEVSLYSNDIPSPAYLIGKFLINPQRLRALESLVKTIRTDSPEDFEGTTEVKDMGTVESLKDALKDENKDNAEVQ
jgi:hypothetical protein